MVHLIKVAGGAAEPSSASRDDGESVGLPLVPL